MSSCRETELRTQWNLAHRNLTWLPDGNRQCLVEVRDEVVDMLDAD